MAPPAHILYLTFEGLLQPLGRSQVLAYVEGLVDRGFQYHIVSRERPEHLQDVKAVRGLRERLAARRIGWTYGAYKRGSIRSAAGNLRDTLADCRRVLNQESIGLIHARSYQAATIAYLFKTSQGIPYLFDTRGYWIEEKRDAGRWFQSALSYRIGKSVERRLYQGAAGVVSLTELSIQDLRDGHFGELGREKPAVAIPTCTDDGEVFLFDRECRPPVSADGLADRLAGKEVFGFVGSINPSYLVGEALDIFRRVRKRRGHAVHLLCISKQTEAMREAVTAAEIPESAVTVLSASYEDMPRWMSCMDWGFLMLRSDASKRASMPTKLAEFLVTGVRPIYFGCNSEVEAWVRRAGSGVVVPDLSPKGLERAAELIVTTDIGRGDLLRAREIAHEHFGLVPAVDRYQKLLEELLRDCD